MSALHGHLLVVRHLSLHLEKLMNSWSVIEIQHPSKKMRVFNLKWLRTSHSKRRSNLPRRYSNKTRESHLLKNTRWRMRRPTFFRIRCLVPHL